MVDMNRRPLTTLLIVLALTSTAASEALQIGTAKQLLLVIQLGPEVTSIW